jgi:hypothetical protein
VLDGQDAVVALASGHAGEDALRAALGGIVHAVAKLMHGDLMGPGTRRSQVGDFEIVFESQRRAHDLAKNSADGFFRELAILSSIELAELLQQGLFPTGHINVEAVLLFDLTDLLDEVGALVQQANELLVDGVDLGACVIQ